MISVISISDKYFSSKTKSTNINIDNYSVSDLPKSQYIYIEGDAGFGMSMSINSGEVYADKCLGVLQNGELSYNNQYNLTDAKVLQYTQEEASKWDVYAHILTSKSYYNITNLFVREVSSFSGGTL
jgi:hypothetical protein